MMIARAHSQIVRLPSDEPLAGAPAFGGLFRELVTVQVETGVGVEGVGVTFFGATLTAT